MLKEKSVNLVKPIVNENYVKICKNQLFEIERIDKEIINKIIVKRNSFNKCYNLNLISEKDLKAFITSINAIAVDENGIMWADFNITIYSE